MAEWYVLERVSRGCQLFRMDDIERRHAYNLLGLVSCRGQALMSKRDWLIGGFVSGRRAPSTSTIDGEAYVNLDW